MAKVMTTKALAQEYERLKGRLLKLGPVVQGSILERTVEREDPAAPGGVRRLGPYYQWTRKIKGRTVNVNLAAGQAKAYGAAIEQHRKMEKILDRMRELSLALLAVTTEGVKKRKSNKSKEKALS